MNITVLDNNFCAKCILDEYESFIWVDKFYEPGTFELYTKVTNYILSNIKADDFLQIPESEHTMIVEDISIESDIESGDHIKIVGRSLESMLDRRIVWTQTNLETALYSGIKKLLDDAIVNPLIAERKINEFTYKLADTDLDAKIRALTMDHQYTGDNLLDIVTDLCSENKIGYKITLNRYNQFVFELYSGENRTYEQDKNPFVVFSPSYGNIINSNYTEKSSVVKKVALVAGEGEGTSRITSTVGSASGFTRKEVYVDARDIRKENLDTNKYKAKLNSKGLDKLNEINKDRKEIDGKCDTSTLYKYGRDFFLGDIVQIENEYGMESPSRVTEFTWSSSSSGLETYPTFATEEEES